MEDEDSMDGLETTETENIVETGIKTEKIDIIYTIHILSLLSARISMC